MNKGGANLTIRSSAKSALNSDSWCLINQIRNEISVHCLRRYGRLLWHLNVVQNNLPFMSVHLYTIARLALLLCLGMCLTGCEQGNSTPFFQSQTQTTTDPSVLNVNAMRISKVENAIEISVFFGTLQPNRQSQLRFRQGGQIKSFSKEVGQSVVAGEPIAQLEMAALENQKTELEQAIQRASQPPNGQPQLDTQQLQSQLQTIQSELNRGIIFAPYDCIVAAQNVVAGDSVSPQSSIATVVEKLPVHVQVNLPVKIAQSLEDGSEVWVIVGEESVKAQVKNKSPVESTAGSRIVSFQITDPIETASWSFGQTVKIRFLTTTDNSGFWIPTSALSRESTGLWSALVVAEAGEGESADRKNFSVQRRMVELVQFEDDWALAQGSLADGELVIVNGSHRVVPGQKVDALDVSAQYAKPSEGAGE